MTRHVTIYSFVHRYDELPNWMNRAWRMTLRTLSGVEVTLVPAETHNRVKWLYSEGLIPDGEFTHIAVGTDSGGGSVGLHDFSEWMKWISVDGS